MRTLCASTLIGEFFVIGFAGLVAMQLSDLSGGHGLDGQRRRDAAVRAAVRHAHPSRRRPAGLGRCRSP